MIDLSNLAFRYEAMLMDFSLHVPRGSFTAVIGPSGAGKSTLLNLIAGFEQPLSGTLKIGGRDMAGLAPASRPVNMIFQDHNVFAHLDVFSNVALGITPSLKLSAAQKRQVDDTLTRTGLDPLASRKPGDLSGGERQRIAIARALVRNKPVLLLDEPFVALGPALRRDMLGLVREVKSEKSLTVLMVTHQPEDAKAAADRTAFVAEGRVIACRPTTELFSSTDVPGLRNYLA
jgi:thiamine transport system ATP-binding protein